MKPFLPTLLCAASLTASALADPSSSDLANFDFVVDNQIRRVTVQLNPTAAPQTVENFRKLVSEKFYDGLAVHRSIPDYLLQVGDPLSKDDSKKPAWGTGTPGYTVPAEIKLPHKRGSLAMARLPDGRNPKRESNGSQFYFVLGDLSHLNGQYTVFGEVVRGLEHLDYLAHRTTDTNDVPVHRIRIGSATLGDGASPSQMSAIAQSAQSAVATASGGVRKVGSAVTDMDNLIPKIDVPKVGLSRIPFIGRDKSEPPVESQAVVMEEVPDAADEASPAKRGLRLPELSVPSLPKFSMFNRSGSDEASVPADGLSATSGQAPSAPLAPAPMPPVPASAKADAPKTPPGVAPDFDLLEDEIASFPVDIDPAVGPGPVPVPELDDAFPDDASPAPAPPAQGRERVVVPVNKTNKDGKPEGFLTRTVKRFW